MNLETQLLSDPKKKLTNRQRKNFWKLHEKKLDKPWWRARPTRVGISDALTKANKLRDLRRKPAGFVKFGPAPKPVGEKIIHRLARMSLKQLSRFVKKSARRASSAMYAAQKCSGSFAESFQQEQMRQLALYRAGLRLIQLRLDPLPISPSDMMKLRSNEI